MSKLIITHINPDLDAIASVWLLRRFEQDFSDASIDFIPAGTTWQNQKVDSDSDIVHVDTGFGQFDHHQTGEYICAATLVLAFLQNKYSNLKKNEALERLVEIVLQIDHFKECCWSEARNDRYQFVLSEILDGLKHNNTLTDQGLIDFGSTCLDGVYTMIKLKVQAEQEISKGKEFNCQWGMALAVETKNDEVIPTAQKMGYVLVIRKDPEGMVRIKGNPGSKVDLTEAFIKVKQMDPEATWFLHASKKMLLNGSYKNPNSVFSKLNLDQLLELFRI
ncbi:DHH family phosphoesterase [Candidatus Beckwithbacteria bacterium]|nr:DHH family phosphoesterase [Candidatus Beckwithbacteria bacterium]